MHVFRSLLACAVFVGATLAQCSTAWATGTGALGTFGTVNALVRWDPDGAGPTPIRLVLGGSFTTAGDVMARTVATWDPSTGAWSSLGSWTAGNNVLALAVAANGELIAAGCAKVNISTALKRAFIEGYRNYLTAHPSAAEPLTVIAQVRQDLQQIVVHYIRQFGSAGSVSS